jgi:hypothetical protein
LSVKPTTEAVSREPAELIKTFGDDPSITATTELVVPKSIPMILAMIIFLSLLPLSAINSYNFSMFEYAKSVPVVVLRQLELFNFLYLKKLSFFLPSFFKFQLPLYSAILAESNDTEKLQTQ